MVLVVSPEDSRPGQQGVMVEAAWTAARRHPALNDIRFIIYADRESGGGSVRPSPPEKDIYLGNVFLPPEEVEAFRQIPTLEEAPGPLGRPCYLDWEWVYQREASSTVGRRPGLGRSGHSQGPQLGRFPELGPVQHAEPPGPARFPLDPEVPAPAGPRTPISGQGRPVPDSRWNKGPGGRLSGRPQGSELVFAFDFKRPWTEAFIRGYPHLLGPNRIHRTPGLPGRPGLAAGLPATRGGHRRKLAAFRLTPESGSAAEDRRQTSFS